MVDGKAGVATARLNGKEEDVPELLLVPPTDDYPESFMVLRGAVVPAGLLTADLSLSGVTLSVGKAGSEGAWRFNSTPLATPEAMRLFIEGCGSAAGVHVIAVDDKEKNPFEPAPGVQVRRARVVAR